MPRSLRPDGATQQQREGRCSLGDSLEWTTSVQWFYRGLRHYGLKVAVVCFP